LKDKRGRLREKHAIKTFKVKKWVECNNRDRLREKQGIKTFKMKERIDCINRDRNACLNMRKLVVKYLKTGEWSKPYVNTKRYQSFTGNTTSLASSGVKPPGVHSKIFIKIDSNFLSQV